VTARLAPWVADTGTRITRRQARTRRRRDTIVSAASLASCDISILISRNWLASMGSQRWGCDADDSRENSHDEQRKPHVRLLNLLFPENPIADNLFPAREGLRRTSPSCRTCSENPKLIRWARCEPAENRVEGDPNANDEI
jgi:hypothetical protein